MEPRRRVLLVEDETEIMHANEKYLSGQGYEVRCADTLAAARASLWEYPPDLIVLDVMLPDGSGFDFCREIRAFTGAPVLFLTALGEEGRIVEGLGLGGDDYLVKPYSMPVLGARLGALLRRGGQSGSSVELDPLHIDLVTGRAFLRGRELDLTRREFQLLVYLAENRGRELSQREIYETLWGAGPEHMGNTVRMAVSRLRSKLCLGEADSCFALETTANQGYLFLRVSYPRGE